MVLQEALKSLTDFRSFNLVLPPHYFLDYIFRPHGLLSAEHSGKPAHSNDGCCLSLLISIRVPLEDVVLIDKYAWLELGMISHKKSQITIFGYKDEIKI